MADSRDRKAVRIVFGEFPDGTVQPHGWRFAFRQCRSSAPVGKTGRVGSTVIPSPNSIMPYASQPEDAGSTLGNLRAPGEWMCGESGEKGRRMSAGKAFRQSREPARLAHGYEAVASPAARDRRR